MKKIQLKFKGRPEDDSSILVLVEFGDGIPEEVITKEDFLNCLHTKFEECIIRIVNWAKEKQKAENIEAIKNEYVDARKNNRKPGLGLDRGCNGCPGSNEPVIDPPAF